MWLVRKDRVVPQVDNRGKIENFVERSLLGDWVIRVEYSASGSRGTTDWLQWGAILFAIRYPEEVMNAIDTCYANSPAHEIRIHAEKLQPETRMFYSINRPMKSDLKGKASLNVVKKAAIRKWPRPIVVAVPSAMGSLWRYIAAVGTLAGTFIVWEAASN